MKKDELKIIISISIAAATIISFLYVTLLKQSFILQNIVRGLSFGLTLTTFFWTFYFSYAWKWSLFDLIFYRPNLNGTWAGTLISDWKDDNGNTHPPIEIYLVIRQSFLRIHFTTFTNNFVGVSYAETLSLNKEKGLKNVTYLYRKDTSQNNEEVLREGATELRLILTEKKKKLEGKYWSNIKTQGKVCVEFRSSKQVDSFEDAQTILNNE